MENKKQSSIDFIFNAFNLLSDADFKAWMLNNHDVIEAMHKEEIESAYRISPNNEIWSNSGIDYYNETFGGNNE